MVCNRNWNALKHELDRKIKKLQIGWKNNKTSDSIYWSFESFNFFCFVYFLHWFWLIITGMFMNLIGTFIQYKNYLFFFSINIFYIMTPCVVIFTHPYFRIFEFVTRWYTSMKVAALLSLIYFCTQFVLRFQCFKQNFYLEESIRLD